MRRLTLALLAPILPAIPAAAGREDWVNYEVILYQDQPAAAYAGLKWLGYSAAEVFGRREGLDPDQARQAVAPHHAAGLGWYVENIAINSGFNLSHLFIGNH